MAYFTPDVFADYGFPGLPWRTDRLAGLVKKRITFAVSNSIEPFFFTDTNTGLQYELLETALSLHNIEMGSITYATNLRSMRLVKNNEVDCIINAPANAHHLFYTQSLIDYQNSVFFLSKNKLNIKTISDLSKYPLLGFQNASQYLGKEFAKVAMDHMDYYEASNQKNQVAMLFGGHIHVIVLEQRIFEYYREQLKGKADITQEVTQLALFDKAPRPIACYDADIAKTVDEAITLLKQSHLDEEILNRLNHTHPKNVN